VLQAALRLAVLVERRGVGRALGHLVLEVVQLLLERHQVGAAGHHVVAQRQVLVARRALVVQGDPHVLLEDQLAAVDRRLPGQHAQQRGLAGAVAARQRHALAALELEGHAAQQRVARHVLAQVGCDQDRHQRSTLGGERQCTLGMPRACLGCVRLCM
jgi:hypothetical protein